MLSADYDLSTLPGLSYFYRSVYDYLGTDFFMGSSFNYDVLSLSTAFFFNSFKWFIINNESAFLIESNSYFYILGVCVVELFLRIYSIRLIMACFWEFYWANLIFYRFKSEFFVFPRCLALYCRDSPNIFNGNCTTWGFLSYKSSFIYWRFPASSCFSQKVLTSWKCCGASFLLKVLKSSILHKLKRHCSTAFWTYKL